MKESEKIINFNSDVMKDREENLFCIRFISWLSNYELTAISHNSKNLTAYASSIFGKEISEASIMYAIEMLMDTCDFDIRPSKGSHNIVLFPVSQGERYTAIERTIEYYNPKNPDLMEVFE